MTDILDRTQPYRVKAPDGRVRLLVKDAKEGLPASFALMGTLAKHKVAVRLGGGCKGMSAEDKTQMINLFREAFRGFQGLIWSGATRQVKEGQVDPMVTDVPGIIAQENPGCVALGTLPRTSMLSLQDDSRFVLDNYGTVVNPDTYGVLIVQNGADGKSDWDGDVNDYFTLMQNWRDHAGFTALGVCAWNGGDITKAEIVRSANLGWPTFVVRGSGRACDEIIGLIENGKTDTISGLKDSKTLVIVDKNNPADLKNQMMMRGFFPQVLPS